MREVHHHRGAWLGASVALLTLAWGGCATTQARASGSTPSADQRPSLQRLRDDLPYRGYLEAHTAPKPQALLGGPIKISIRQSQGGVFVTLPDHRRLDPAVFGTPRLPRAFAGTPGITGVPPMARAQEGGRYTFMKKPSPFGDKYIVLPDGELEIEAVDATATDGPTSEDRVRFHAKWRDREGNTYEVRCCKKLATRGLEYPTFGGVLTNHILHGSSRIGTPLMPTEFTYFAFWGMGSLSKNGKVVAQPRLIHGMLTEYVRTEGYKLADDAHVTPGRLHFHLMVPPFQPNMRTHHFDHSPVPTGFRLPNGKQLPFWHVMFENLEVEGERG